MKDETRDRITSEIQRLHGELLSCPRCEAMRKRMVDLSGLLPPDPLTGPDGRRYVFNPPPEYDELVERQLKRLLGEDSRPKGANG